LQSKYEFPTPSEWLVWHAEPQHPGVAHSQPSVSGAAVLQSERPAAHTYVHAAPVHDGVPVVALHWTSHAPQWSTLVSGPQPPASPPDSATVEPPSGASATEPVSAATSGVGLPPSAGGAEASGPPSPPSHPSEQCSLL
jgi:hypothetical protein